MVVRLFRVQVGFKVLCFDVLSLCLFASFLFLSCDSFLLLLIVHHACLMLMCVLLLTPSSFYSNKWFKGSERRIA